MTLRRRNPIPAGVAAPIPAVSTACVHPALLNSMCVACGQYIKTAVTLHQKDENGVGLGAQLTMTGGQQLQFLSEKALLEQQQEKLAGLQKVRKLALILDLDHTLIHTTAADSVPSAEFLQEGEIHHLCIEEKVDIVGPVAKHYLVKKRPHLDEFLMKANELFQMTIYTAGTRKYAEAIAKLMDPTGKLFSGRMVSRSDIPNDKSGGLEKSLARLFLGDASMAIIVDDREDVWKGEQGRQLFLVRPFVHFTGAHEVNNDAGATCSGQKLISMMGSDCEATEDDQLPRCLQVLSDIRHEYYATYDELYMKTSSTTVDITTSQACLSASCSIEEHSLVPASNHLSTLSLNSAKFSTAHALRSAGDLLVSKKLAILHGCVISFSGLIPINERKPAEKCLLWRLALSLGAQVSVEVTARTTHLVAASADSSKAADCHKRGDVWIVHPDWLMYCRWAMQKVPELTFILIAPSSARPLPAPVLDPTPLPMELTERQVIDTEVNLLNSNASFSKKRKEFDETEDSDFATSIRKLRKVEHDNKVQMAKQRLRDENTDSAEEDEPKERGHDSSDSEDCYGDFDELMS